jgi:hypothetical protein
MLWEGNVAPVAERIHTYEILVGKPEGKGPVGRRNCKLWDNIKMDLRDMELDSSILG